jgi:hypothetical protein
MARIKGTNLVVLRETIKARGFEFETTFQNSLTPTQRQLYETVMATSWSPIELQMDIYLAAIKLLLPNHPNPRRELGRLLSQKAYKGIYKVFFRIPGVSYVIARAAEVWNTYYDTGAGEIEHATPNSADFVVFDFPDLPAPMREIAAGNMIAIVELAGGKNCRIELDESNPKAWRWMVKWD